jgi:antitoxin YefM
MTLSIKQDIRPISDFRKSSAQLLKRLKADHHPIILTQRGRSVAVIIDVDTYERLDYENRFRNSYFEGVRDIEQGHVASHAEVMKQARQAASIPSSK